MIRELALAVVLIALVFAALYVLVERPAVEAENLVICTNGRTAWACPSLLPGERR